MNKKRKNRLSISVSHLKSLLQSGEYEKLAPIIDAVEDVLEDEDSARENRPENLRETEQVFLSEEACECMCNAIDCMHGAATYFEIRDIDNTNINLRNAVCFLTNIRGVS